MKHLALVLSFIGALATPAYASITLTTPYTLSGPAGTVAAGTANSATATGKTFDWQANQACITYSFGTVTKTGSTDTSFAVLAGAPTITNCLNLTTGNWQATTSGFPGGVIMTGTLTGGQLSSAITVYSGPLTPLRDAADFFASTTFLPGTQSDTW